MCVRAVDRRAQYRMLRARTSYMLHTGRGAGACRIYHVQYIQYASYTRCIHASYRWRSRCVQYIPRAVQYCFIYRTSYVLHTCRPRRTRKRVGCRAVDGVRRVSLSLSRRRSRPVVGALPLSRRHRGSSERSSNCPRPTRARRGISTHAPHHDTPRGILTDRPDSTRPTDSTTLRLQVEALKAAMYPDGFTAKAAGAGSSH